MNSSHQNKTLNLVLISMLALTISSCGSSHNVTNMVVVNVGYKPSGLDPQNAEDYSTHRITGDLFEGLLSYDQSNQPIPGLAEYWEISEDGKTYTFYLNKDLKFSDGTPITANDVIFTWRRLISESTASPYQHLLSNVQHAHQIMDGTLPNSALGVIALNQNTVQITLNHPDSEFLQICALRDLGVVSKANINKFGTDWTKPKNMVSSGAYVLDKITTNGDIILTKNPNYHDAINVNIPKITFVVEPITTNALKQYKAGKLDITKTVPIDQYNKLKLTVPQQLHTVSAEDIVFIDFNMLLPKFRDNKRLRQALTMAINREKLVTQVLGQGQTPLYSYVTSTIDDGNYRTTTYEWSLNNKSINNGKYNHLKDMQVNLLHEQQNEKARELFKDAGYGPQNPLKFTLAIDSDETRKKVALAVVDMWKSVLGNSNIQVTLQTKDWQTFLDDQHDGNFDLVIAHWSADYDSVYSYTTLYKCNNPHNFSHYCNEQFDKLIADSNIMGDKQYDIVNSALEIVQNDYPVIPLFQDTYYRLINPKIRGYIPEVNHLDHVQSKWY